MTPGADSRSEGFGSSSPQDHVLRNHSVGKHAKPGRFRAAIVHGDADEDVFRRLPSRTRRTRRSSGRRRRRPVSSSSYSNSSRERLPVRLDQVRVGILALRVLVEVLHVRVRRRAVEVEVVLLDVLAVVALAVGQSEQALLQDGVALVPERQREAQPLLVVGEAAEPVLAPPVGSRARLVVREVVPGVAVVAVVLADRAPLPLTEVRPPLLPGDAAPRAPRSAASAR